MSKYDLDFTGLEQKQIPVISPGGKRYMLCSASGKAGTEYNNARAACVRFADGKMAGVRGPGALEPLLVSLCLFHIDTEGQPDFKRPVDINEIQSWPYPVQKRLHDVAKEISEIEEPETLETLIEERNRIDKRIKELQDSAAKNEQDGTMGGSD